MDNFDAGDDYMQWASTAPGLDHDADAEALYYPNLGDETAFYSPAYPMHGAGGSSPSATTMSHHFDYMSEGINATGSPGLQLVEDVPEHIIAVSTYFHPTRFLPSEPDLTLYSVDGIYFYVEMEKIAKVSEEALCAFLRLEPPGAPENDAVAVPETGEILTIILHAVYGSSPGLNHPSADKLIEAVDKMPQYGLVPRDIIQTDSPLYDILQSHAALSSIDIYALAAHHNIMELAKSASSRLHSFPLHQITDAMATRVGPIYLKHLFLLHLGRTDAMKTIFGRYPGFHPLTRDCSFEYQRRLTRAWSLGSTFLAWECGADLSTQRIRSVFEPMTAKMDCHDCKKNWEKHIRETREAWAAVKMTI